VSENSPYVGKYVCFGLSDGSFTWGRIKADAVVNTPNGPKEVFVLTDRMTCYVPKGELAEITVSVISKRISAGTAGPMALPGRTDPETLPEYQKGAYKAALPEAKPNKDSGNKALPVKKESTLPAVPEASGVPELSEIMDIEKSPGLNMFEKVGRAQSSIQSGRHVDYIFRKYGYDTNVRKDQLNLDPEKGDVVDREILGLDDLTDDELFLIAMKAKIDGMGFNQGARNMLRFGLSPLPKHEVEEKAVALLKERKNVKPK